MQSEIASLDAQALLPPGKEPMASPLTEPRLDLTTLEVTAFPEGPASELTSTGFALPVPFVALQPGPTGNTLGKVDGTQLITVTGDVKTYPTDGKLLLTTVSEQPTLTLFSVVGHWLSSHDAVVPEELVNPTGSSQQEQQRQGQADMVTSQENATTAALHYLKVPAKVTVTSVTKGLPADGVLEPRDVITSVDGKPISDSVALRTAISPLAPRTITAIASVIVSPTSAIGPIPSVARRRTHSAPARVLPAPRPPSSSQVTQSPGGGNCSARAQSGQSK